MPEAALTYEQEDQLAAYARECLAEAQQHLNKAAALIDLSNRALMEAGAPGWNLADAWSKVGAVQAAIDKHIEAYFQHDPRCHVERSYRRELAKLVTAVLEPDSPVAPAAGTAL